MISMLPKKGCLLVAEPTILNDISFNRSVILLTEHTKDGSVGFILNKPLSYSINELIPEINANFMVYNGGPVEQDNLYFLHNVPELIPESVEISKENIRFFFGYSGWDTHQLEEELNDNSWIIVENELQSKIIAKNSQNFWKEKLNEIGGEYIYFSNSPENPALN